MTNLSDREILNFAFDNGIIDITTIQKQIEMNERIKYLEMHNSRIWESTDGRWYTYVPDANYEKGRRLIKRNTSRDLEDALVKFYKEWHEEPTIESVFYEWLADKMKYEEIRKQTRDRYKRDFNRFFKEFGKRKIRYVSEYELEDFIKTSIHDLRLTSKAWSNARTILNGVFRCARKKGYTKINITNFMQELDLSRKSFKKSVKTDEKNVFTNSEVEKIVEYCKKNTSVYHYAILVAIYTGMRAGEIVALQKSDVFDTYIYVHKTQVRYESADGEIVYEIQDETKTDMGTRKVVIAEPLKPIIKRLMLMTFEDDYIFSKNGIPIKTTALTSSLYRLCDKIEIPRRSMHVLRKTYATNLINAKVEPAVIINQMGHTDFRTTQLHYYHNDKTLEEISIMVGGAMNF